MNSKSQQTKEYVLGHIRSGKWQPGDKLPSERDLASALNMSHLTIRRGLEELAKQGIIIKKPGSGNFVADPGEAAAIAVVFPSYLLSDSVQQPAVSLEMRGLEQALDKKYYAMSVMWYRPWRFWEDVGQIIVSRRIKGVVLWGHSLLPQDSIKQLLDNGVEIVGTTSDINFRKLGIATFDLDRTAIQEAAIDGLVGRGHKHIAIALHTEEDQLPILDLSEQLAPAHVADGITIELLPYISKPHLEWPDLTPLENLFKGDNQPTAIIVPEEVVAHEIFRLCYQKNVRVPDDLSIVALSDTTPKAHSVPLSAPDSLACRTELARLAGEHLKAQLEDNHSASTQTSTLLAPAIVWRDSVAKLINDDSTIDDEYKSEFDTITDEAELPDLVPA